MRQKTKASSRIQVLGRFLRGDTTEEASYQRLFSSWQEGVWIVGLGYETLYCNSRIASLFNASLDDFRSKTALEILKEAGLESADDFLTSAAFGPQTTELVVHGSNQSRTWIQLRVNPIFNAKKERTGLGIVIQDSTLHKRVMYTLDSCTIIQNSLCDISKDYIARINTELICTYANPALLKALNKERDEVEGKSITEFDIFFNPLDRWTECIKSSFDSGRSTTLESECKVPAVQAKTWLLPEPNGDFVSSSLLSVTRPKGE